MKEKIMAVILTIAIVLGQQQTVQLVQAAEIRQQETKQILSEAVKDLQEGNYVEGEAVVSMEAAKGAALTREGIYSLDSNVTIESVCDFGTSGQTGKHLYIVHLTSDKYTTEELMALALKQPYVDAVSANQYQQICTSDPYRQKQWYLDGNSTGSQGINFSKQKVTSKETPVIAVIDTGVNYNHPDLLDSMWKNPCPDVLEGTCGYDFGDNDSDPMDENGHGTHVAGIAAAGSDNGTGISGVAKAKIMALKAVRRGADEFTMVSVISAFDYIQNAQEAGVNVKTVNCSWGGLTGNSSINGILEKVINAVGELGAVCVFAAGNDGTNMDNAATAGMIPFCMNSPYVLVVGASNEKDQAAGYSNYGAKSVDLFAPGSDILSTYYENLYLPGIYDSEQRRKTTVYFDRCSDSADNILPQGQTWKDYYTAQELGITTDYSVDISSADDSGNGYLKLSIKRNNFWTSKESEEAGSIYVDVTDLSLDESKTYYLSFVDGVEKNGDIFWESDNMVSSPEHSRFVHKNGRVYMRIVGLQIPMKMTGTVNTWLLDDIAISTADPNPDNFGAYACFSGTSMAAPVVSGAIATLASANPALSAKSLRGLLLKSVRKVDSLSDKCVTGGMIDLSKLVTLSTQVKLNKKRAILHYGKSLTLKAQVSPSDATNKAVTWKSGNSKYAVVSSKGVVKAKKTGIGHTVTITATAKDGSGKKASCKIKIQL